MGDNVFGELGDGTTRQPNTPELITENVERISAGAMHSLFVSRGKIGLYAPQITVQPVNQTVRAGGGANFEVAASGNPAATYRWQVSTDGGFTWTSVTDTATYSITATGTLIITATTAGMNGYEYRCVASNSAGSATSNAATLTVISADQAFLQQLFLDVLGRPIDSGDLSAFGAALAGGESRSAVLGELLTSTEYANRQVEPVIRLYYAALARCPDYVGLQNWSDALQSGVLTLDDAGDQFASSAEFLHDYGNLNNTGYVQQLYRNVLGREADPAGVVHWGLCFLTGATWGHVLIGFSESPEFQADMANQVEIIRLYDLLLQRMPTAVELQTWQGFLLGYDQTDALFAQGYPAGLDDTDYVSLIFQGFLLRGVDAGTLSVFGSALTAGTVTHASLVNTLLNSAEFNQFVAPVSRLYMAAFHRVPDAGGLDNWVAYVRAGNSLQSAADAFVASPEFQLTYGSLNDTQYVTLLYENVLGREPDPIGLADWVAQLRAGTARGQVLIGFSESQEGIARCAPTVRTFLSYFVFIDAAPTQPDLDYWEHYLTTLDDQMRDDLLADPTFAN
jgi:serralysin